MINENLYSVLRAALVSEKTARVQGNDQYVFEISREATKAHVKAAVEKLFNVQVLTVNTLCVKGKGKAFKGRQGVRSGKRKAYVRLREGQTIDVMAKA